LATYPKLPCTACGSYSAYWVDTGWDHQNPFCGECHRLLGTYKEMSGNEKGVAWVFAGIGIFVLGVIGIAVLTQSIEGLSERRIAAQQSSEIDRAKSLVTEARSSTTSLDRLAQLINNPQECTKDPRLKLPIRGVAKFIDCEEALQANVALNVGATAQLLETLVTSDSDWVRASAARNPQLAVESQMLLASDARESVRSSLALNSKLDEEVQGALTSECSKKPPTKTVAHLASNRYASLATFQFLSKSCGPTVLLKLYCNESIPENLRYKLPKRWSEDPKNKLENQSCKRWLAPFAAQDEWVSDEVLEELNAS
jgi:hypothetical protein